MKIKKVALIGHYNLYASKLHFSEKLSEALERQGVETLFVDLSPESVSPESLQNLISFKPDLTLSFNSSQPDAQGKFLWDYLKTPHLNILLDPPLYYLYMARSPYSLFSCVDELDLLWLKKRGVEKSFFLPHAIERELHHPPEADRPYEVSFIGSCYDIEQALKEAEQLFAPPLFKVVKTSIQRVEEEFESPFAAVLEEELLKAGLVVSEPQLLDLARIVDNTTRGKERLELIQSFTSVPVHIFGEEAWQTVSKPRSWQELLAGQKNLIFHPSLSYPESLEVLKKTKISLNSMPFFKKGTHERLFAGLAAGSVPLTSDNLWIREHFIDGQELLTFRRGDFPTLEARVVQLLSNEPLRQEIARRGQAKTLAHHTWDERAKSLLSYCSDLLS